MKFKDRANRGGESAADFVRDGRHLMQQDERRIDWFRASEVPALKAGDIVHLRPGRIGVERPLVPLPLMGSGHAARR